MGKVLFGITMVFALVFISACGEQERGIDTNQASQNSSQVQEYKSEDGWSFNYPATWDKVEPNYIQETLTGKTIAFRSMSIDGNFDEWVQNGISKKLKADEADNSLVEKRSVGNQDGSFSKVDYAILSVIDGKETLLKTTVFYDGSYIYEFHTQTPPVMDDEYDLVINSVRTRNNGSIMALPKQRQ